MSDPIFFLAAGAAVGFSAGSLALFFTVRRLAGSDQEIARKDGLLKNAVFLLLFAGMCAGDVLDCLRARPGGEFGMNLISAAVLGVGVWMQSKRLIRR